MIKPQISNGRSLHGFLALFLQVGPSDSGSQGPVIHLTYSCCSQLHSSPDSSQFLKKRMAGWSPLACTKLSWFCSALSGSLSPHPLHMQVCPTAKSVQSPWSYNSSLAPDLVPEELSHSDSLVTTEANTPCRSLWLRVAVPPESPVWGVKAGTLASVVEGWTKVALRPFCRETSAFLSFLRFP